MTGIPPQKPVEAAGLARCFWCSPREGHGARSGAFTARLRADKTNGKIAITDLFREQGAGNFDAI